MNDNMEAGADIHAGDGGYRLGTREGYDDFVKKRNPMNERIRELAEQAGSTHKQNLGVYQFYTDELEKFAELIVRECLFIIDDERKPEMVSRIELWKQIVEHFGVKQ